MNKLNVIEKFMIKTMDKSIYDAHYCKYHGLYLVKKIRANKRCPQLFCKQDEKLIGGI